MSMQPQPNQQHNLSVSCVTASSAQASDSGCFIQSPSMLMPHGAANHSFVNQTLQHGSSEHHPHSTNNIKGLVEPTFPGTNTTPVQVNSTALMSTFNPCVASQALTPVSTTGLASFFGAPSKPRTESFAFDEVKILLQEIELRKHVLLSISHSMNRFKRRAWEEVAINMANRCPYSPKRTADQVKKKWENLVSKTKRKLRSGRVTAETDWSDTNTAVLEFLAHHNPFLRMRYATAAASILSSTSPTGKRNSGTTTITTDFVGLTRMYDTQMQSRGLPGLNMPNNRDLLRPGSGASQPIATTTAASPLTTTIIKEEVKSVSSTELNMDDELDDSVQTDGFNSVRRSRDTIAIDTRTNNPTTNSHPIDGQARMTDTSHMNSLSGLSFGNNNVTSQMIQLPDSSGGPRVTCHLDQEHTRQLMEQLTREHSVRMEILQLQKQAWQLQVEVLQRSVGLAK